MYQNKFVQFSRLIAQGLGTNGKYIRYASVRFLFFKLTQTALQKIKKSIHPIHSNCAFTKIEAVLIDVYESFYKNEGIWEEKKQKITQLILILFHLKLNSKHLTTIIHLFRQENSNNNNFRFILMAAHVKMSSLLPKQ